MPCNCTLHLFACDYSDCCFVYSSFLVHETLFIAIKIHIYTCSPAHCSLCSSFHIAQIRDELSEAPTPNDLLETTHRTLLHSTYGAHLSGRDWSTLALMLQGALTIEPKLKLKLSFNMVYLLVNLADMRFRHAQFTSGIWRTSKRNPAIKRQWSLQEALMENDPDMRPPWEKDTLAVLEASINRMFYKVCDDHVMYFYFVGLVSYCGGD